MAQKIQTQFKSAKQSSFIARQISQNLNRGSAIEAKIETVLNQLRENVGTRSLKKIDQNSIQAYVNALQEKVQTGELSTKTASGYVSALNDVIRYTNEQLNKGIQTISAREVGCLSKGSIQYQNRVVSSDTHAQFKEYLSQQQDIRAQALTQSGEFQRQFGLRLRESISIKRETIRQALKTGELQLSRQDGTKNSQARTIPITSESQKQALQNALGFIREYGLKSLIPTDTRKEQYQFAQNVKTQFNQQHPDSKMDYHGERHFFAQLELSRFASEGNPKEEAIQAITEELGHHREEILKHYIPM